MNEGTFHLLIEFARRDPLEFTCILLGIPLLLLLLTAATVRRIHPVVVWAAFTAAFFGLSQIFPENRNQRVSLAVIEGIVCAVLVWWWFGRVAPELRARFQRRQRAEPPANGAHQRDSNR